MGTWSNTPFGNDAAMDWLAQAQRQSATQFAVHIQNTVSAVVNNWEGDATNATRALAAIAIVSASAVEPIGSCHKDAKSLISLHGFTTDNALLDKSLSAIQNICHAENSELRELWIKANGLPSWLKNTEEIAENLRAALKLGVAIRKPKKLGMPRTLIKLLERYKTEPSPIIRENIYEKFSALEDVNGLNKDTDFQRPLYLACLNGLLEESQLLIKRDANVNLGDSPESTPFEAACISGNLTLCELLRENGAQIFSEINDKNNHQAESFTAVRLRELGAARLPTGYRYCPALSKVALEGKPETMDYLITLGADISQLNRNLENLAHLSCYKNNVPVLSYLLKAGFDLHKPVGTLGQQALDIAVRWNAIESVEFLLSNGANPNRIGLRLDNEEADSPLDTARSEWAEVNKAIEELLLSHGAKTTAELQVG
jgi:ankyrin repeat protein